MNTEIFYQGVPVIVVIIALIELFKNLGMSVRLAPLASLILGLLAGYFLLNNWFTGLVIGLTASGLFDIAKKTILGK